MDSTSTDRNSDLKAQCLAALLNSKEKIREVLSKIKEQKMETDTVWQAYSQAELGIGLAKLAFKDKLETKLGKFRELDSREISGRKNDSDYLRKLELDLSKTNRNLDLAISSLGDGKAIEGLEQARKARDLLKLILLEISSGADKRNSRLKSRKLA